MDIADQAQSAEAAHRRAALSNAGIRRREPQSVEDGRIICADCGDPIPAARLAIMPYACRCVQCQEALEASC